MKSLNEGFAWAKRPMVPRVSELDENISLSFIYGAKSWMDPRSGVKVREQLGEDRVTIDMVPDAPHHVFALATVFNELVNRYCTATENSTDGRPLRDLPPSKYAYKEASESE